ncbi:uncharacterized protein LOC131331407 [Rhododendron vialii]|uniref:uncharacterized protein LOC131331407 n=1 Tax=Rhododendron vialii TaxID=182163 RepID=UPI00265FDCC1|nr:uncharacterized protein LOC131331407 [Rhododendron vialii]
MATNGNVSIKIEDDDEVEVGGVADSLWSKTNEEFFIDIMEEEVKTMGSRDTGTFQEKSWARIRKSLSAKPKHEYSELQIKNKFNQLRTMHTKFKSLCDQSGIGWCAKKGTVAADDTLWEKLYKVMEVSNTQNDVVADSDNMVFEEGKSLESVNNICKSTGHVHDYESSDTISLKLGFLKPYKSERYHLSLFRGRRRLRKKNGSIIVTRPFAT